MTLRRMTLVTTPCGLFLSVYLYHQASNITDHSSCKLMLHVSSGKLCYHLVDSLSSQNRTHLRVTLCSKSSCGAVLQYNVIGDVHLPRSVGPT